MNQLRAYAKGLDITKENYTFSITYGGGIGSATVGFREISEYLEDSKDSKVSAYHSVIVKKISGAVFGAFTSYCRVPPVLPDQPQQMKIEIMSKAAGEFL
jgi:hypothetical protein